MLETYYKYRQEYKDTILFIKVGSFYETFDKDALILNKLFGYKVKRIKDKIKAGFPISRLDYVLRLIGNINYTIIDNKEIKEKRFKDNEYNTYDFNINSIILKGIRADKIYDTLNNRLLDNNIDNIITKIELIIGKNI